MELFLTTKKNNKSLLTMTTVTNADLGLSEDHFSCPEGCFGLSTVEELEMAIENCKELVVTAEPHTEKRHQLVEKLVQLRITLQETKESEMSSQNDENENTLTVLGHNFVKMSSKSSKHYCEKCTTVIWGVLQPWYRCNECGFSCHGKCISYVTRICAAQKVSESPKYTISICPLVGLAQQMYRCADCRSKISFSNENSSPRLCDYSGLYYCQECHWNDAMVIPARVIHNWDFEPRLVSRSAKQFLKLMIKKPVLNVAQLNPNIFGFVEELNSLRGTRQKILMMKQYFITCKDALENKLLLLLQERQHFVENSTIFALKDLLDLENGTLLPQLEEIMSVYSKHIRVCCKLCQAKAFVCEICDRPDQIFPFDNETSLCEACSTVYHTECFENRSCPKCNRINHRSSEM